jgi:hypothetical protein
MAHIRTHSSNEFEGRSPGTKGREAGCRVQHDACSIIEEAIVELRAESHPLVGGDGAVVGPMAQGSDVFGARN